MKKSLYILLAINILLFVAIITVLANNLKSSNPNLDVNYTPNDTSLKFYVAKKDYEIAYTFDGSCTEGSDVIKTIKEFGNDDE